MKKYLLLFASVLMLASCSTPKYAYYFDHYDYNSGKKKIERPKTVLAENLLATPEMSPLQINQEALVASAEGRITHVENVPVLVSDKNKVERKYSSLTKSEKRAFKKELKTEVKKYLKNKKSGDNITSNEATKVMDHDLKLALIFGIVGIVLSALGGVNSIFWILGVVATVIAIVFLIKWIANQ